MKRTKYIHAIVPVAVAAFAPFAEARVVHSPAAALQSAYNDGITAVNPVTVNAATWEFSRRKWGNDPAGTQLNAPHSSGKVCRGLLGDGGGIGKASVVGNNTESYDSARGLAAREVLLSPANKADEDEGRNGGYCRATMAFTVPRSGRYSLSVAFRTMDEVAYGGYSDVWVMLDDSPIFRRELRHDPDAAPARCSYGFSNCILAAGQKIVIAVGPGLTEAQNDSDSVALKLEIVEEDETANLVAKTWDFGKSLSANTYGASPTMPFADANGGSWNCYMMQRAHYEYQPDVAADTYVHSLPIPDLLTGLAFSARLDDGHGILGWYFHSAWGIPFVRSIPTGTAAVNSYVTESPLHYPAAPGEVALQPSSDANWYSAVVRFTVPEAGRYALGLALRDTELNTAGGSGQMGSRIITVGGGAILSDDLIGMEFGEDKGYLYVNRETPVLPVGATIDVFVDGRGYSGGDTSLGRLFVYKLADTAVARLYNAGAALRENVNGSDVNPFVDSQGATWTMGSSGSVGGAFKAATIKQSSEKTKGWGTMCGNAWAAGNWPGLPRIQVSTSLATIEGGTDSNVISGQKLLHNEFLVESAGKVEGSVLRFTAPRDGTYSVRATVRDINDGATGGVMCHLMSGAYRVFRPQLSWYYPAWSSVVGNQSDCWANIASDSIWLRSGESVDLTIFDSRSTWPNDGTLGYTGQAAVQENVMELAKDDRPVISVDFRTSGAASEQYAAQGRFGWSGQCWATTAVSEGALVAEKLASSTIDTTNETRTAFSLSRDAGDLQSAALGLGTLMNDGVVSDSATDTYTFSFKGLKKNTAYELYLYSKSVASGAGVGCFTSGGTTATPSLPWFTEKNDVAVLRVTSDATGTVTAKFASSTDDPVAFCGVQIVGSDFRPPKPGVVVIIR